ncbi:hypothetical protein AUC43_15275 [Hymenobacter sedentarius]|uniref:Phage portal protein n=1 Tax=Hymenobacter sedentarius TaxID=1411621 RepID=A0A0U3SJM5_9BACT|nr:phage portal protein [Hymenobacter sedentarius]ALW86324.1 hypothetical protein AUC43_15275 [Hymenobacter sedentarius]
MSILTNLKNLFITQDAAPFAVEQKALVGVDGIGRTNPVSFSVLNAAPAINLGRNDAQLNIVFATILNAILIASRSIPWNVYKLSKDETAEKVPNHPLGNVLYRPNPTQTWGDFVTDYLGTFISTGNAFILARTNASGLNYGQITQLWLMPKHTEVVPGVNWMSPVQGYRLLRQDGGYDTFSAEEVLHLKTFNPEKKNYGLSPLSTGLLALTSLDYAMRERIQQLANGGPKTVFFNASEEVEGDLTEAQERDLYAKLNRRGSQATYVPSKIGTAQLGLSPAELDVLNSIQADKGMVADLLNYPDILLSGTKSNTYNNVAEAQKALYNNCLIPHLRLLQEGLNYKFGGAYKDQVYIDLDLSGVEVLKPNTTALITAANSADFLTVNEKRKLAGYQSIDGGDGFLRSAAIGYVSTIDEQDQTPADAYATGDAAVPEE